MDSFIATFLIQFDFKLDLINILILGHNKSFLSAGII